MFVVLYYVLVVRAVVVFCLRVVFRTCSCVSFSQFGFLLARCVCYAMDGVGWVLTFLELTHMLDPTQWMGWGGVGGWDVNVP